MRSIRLSGSRRRRRPLLARRVDEAGDVEAQGVPVGGGILGSRCGNVGVGCPVDVGRRRSVSPSDRRPNGHAGGSSCQRRRRKLVSPAPSKCDPTARIACSSLATTAPVAKVQEACLRARASVNAEDEPCTESADEAVRAGLHRRRATRGTSTRPAPSTTAPVPAGVRADPSMSSSRPRTRKGGEDPPRRTPSTRSIELRPSVRRAEPCQARRSRVDSRRSCSVWCASITKRCVRGAVEGDEVCEIAGLGPIPAAVGPRPARATRSLKLVRHEGGRTSRT